MTKENETKSEKFVRVANGRTKKAIKQLRLIKQVVGSKNYDVDGEQVNKLVNVLYDEVTAIANAYKARTQSKEPIEDVF